MLIIFAGLPGTGKTTLATEIARRIQATYLRIDSIEQAMTNSSLKIDPVEDAGYVAGFECWGWCGHRFPQHGPTPRPP